MKCCFQEGTFFWRDSHRGIPRRSPSPLLQSPTLWVPRSVPVLFPGRLSYGCLHSRWLGMEDWNTPDRVNVPSLALSESCCHLPSEIHAASCTALLLVGKPRRLSSPQCPPAEEEKLSVGMKIHSFSLFFWAREDGNNRPWVRSHLGLGAAFCVTARYKFGFITTSGY